ncbi:MAG: ABC transporter permease [Lachnospiraceae bacterium]|nr:ABC transporter permease [Lachnospiraceae bacterium]
MQLGKRASLYVCRKKGKTVLLFVTILLLSSLGVTGLLFRSITDLAITQTRQSLSGAFRIAPDMQNRDNVKVSELNGQTTISYIGEPLDEKIVEAIQSRQKIDAYNAVIKENVLLQGDINLVDFNGKYQDDPIAMHLISVEADTSSLYSLDFQRQRLRLTDGEPIVISDKFTAVISKDLALQNHWEIGDEIQLSPCEGHAGQETRVTIKGLFVVEEKQQNIDVAAPVHLLENRIFIDITTAKLLADTAGVDYIDFIVDDPAQVITIMEEIQKIENINWKCFSISADISEYEKIANPLENMSVLLDTLLTIIGVMSIVVLLLIQILFHKAREHETGIMLSIGISKAEIILQRFIELTMIALVSFILSFVICFSTWNYIGKIICNMTALSMDIKLNTILVSQTIITIFGCGIIVLFLSVLLSNLWLMRLSPKKILSKLS